MLSLHIKVIVSIKLNADDKGRTISPLAIEKKEKKMGHSQLALNCDDLLFTFTEVLMMMVWDDIVSSSICGLSPPCHCTVWRMHVMNNIPED